MKSIISFVLTALGLVFVFTFFDLSETDFTTEIPETTVEVTETVTPEPEPATTNPNIPEYDRSEFGKSWAPIGDGCNVRHFVLANKMDNVVFEDGSPCKVASGDFVDMYTGEHIYFTSENPNAVPVDHIVSLKEAWELGAWAWAYEQRLSFANDVDNLVPTTQYINSWKGAHNADYIQKCIQVGSGCEPRDGVEFTGWDDYITQYNMIKEKYGLN